MEQDKNPNAYDAVAVKSQLLSAQTPPDKVPGKVEQVLDNQQVTFNLLSQLRQRLTPVLIEQPPEPAPERSFYNHVNVTHDNSGYINTELRQLIDDLVI